MSPSRTFPGSVVVGVDGSRSSEDAVRWAGRQAMAESRPLTLLHADAGASLQPAWWCEAYGIDPEQAVRGAAEHATRLLADAAAVAREQAPALDVRDVVAPDDARDALLDASRTAHLLVVGSRGLGRVRSVVLGSTSAAVPRAAGCPVVVVPAGSTRSPGAHVIVGADGTAESLPVLEFAFRQASLARCPLTVMHACWDASVLVTPAHPPHGSPDDVDDPDGLQAVLGESVAGLRDDHPDVEVFLALAHGLVDEVLTRTSRAADLLVVGHHHRGSLSRLLSGSVAVAVLEHATVPVAVVPESAPPRRPTHVDHHLAVTARGSLS